MLIHWLLVMPNTQEDLRFFDFGLNIIQVWISLVEILEKTKHISFQSCFQRFDYCRWNVLVLNVCRVPCQKIFCHLQNRWSGGPSPFTIIRHAGSEYNEFEAYSRACCWCRLISNWITKSKQDMHHKLWSNSYTTILQRWINSNYV